METIVASCITAFITLVICLINNRAQASRTQAVIEVKLQALTEEVRKHNSLIERVYKLEKDSALHEEKIAVANHRISDLEQRGEDLHG